MSSGGYNDEQNAPEPEEIEENQSEQSGESEIDEGALIEALTDFDPTAFNEFLEGVNSEEELENVIGIIEGFQEHIDHRMKIVKAKLQEKKAELKDERALQRKQASKAATALRVEQTQQGNINIVVRFEGNDYDLTVKGIFTLKDLRLRLMLLFPDVFTTQSMTEKLVYELNGVAMNDHARRTMKADKQGQGWNLSNGAVINVRRQTADEAAQAKAKAKAKGKSKAAPKPKSAPSAGSGTQ